MNRSIPFFLKFMMALVASAMCCAAVKAEAINVQTVVASEPGKPGAIPADLARYKAQLASSAFSKFTNGGAQSVTLSAATPKASAQVGGFSLELSRQGAAKVDVTVREKTKTGEKTVFGPITYQFSKEKTKQLELPTTKGAYIVFLTLE
ncbi:MAG: hypothetical protein WCT04_06970 [Planctomycetota bacterium]